MSALRIFALPLIGLILLGGLVYHIFQREMTPPAPSGPPAVHIWADTALRLPLESPDMEHEYGLLGRFQRRTGIRTRVTYGTLADWEAEPDQHGLTDLVLTSNPAWRTWLSEAGSLGPERAFARHVPVILIHEDHHEQAPSPASLRDPDQRLGAGDLHGTVLGQLTVELLTNDTYSIDELQQQVRFVGGSADDVARAVEQNRVDAAIVWRDTALRHARRTTFAPWPDLEVRGPAVYALSLDHSPQGDAAAQLARFLAGPAANSLLYAYGFETVDGK